MESKDESREAASLLEGDVRMPIGGEPVAAAPRAAEALEVGYVEVNGPVSFAFGLPFGGVKQSGNAREGSFDELLSYTRLKPVNVCLRTPGAVARGLRERRAG